MNTNLNEIIEKYDNLGGKKIFKDALKEINSNKKIFLIYSKKRNIPLSAIPTFRLILSSKASFLNFCYSFCNFYNNEIDINEENLSNIIKFIIAHETGHILDKNLDKTKQDFINNLYKLMDLCVKYNFSKDNVPYEIDDIVLDLKKILINREVTAWNIASDLIDFDNDYEVELFNKIKNYALATYNSLNFNSLSKQYNLDVAIKFRKRFSIVY